MGASQRQRAAEVLARGAPGPAEAAPEQTSAPPGWRSARRLSLGVLLVYLAATVAVGISTRYPGVVASGNETTVDRAIFTALNAATLTGFQQTMGVREMSATGWIGPTLLLALTFAGSLLSLMVGGLAAARILRLRHTTWQIIRAALVSVLLAAVAGGAVLVGSGRIVFEAVFQAASAFGNSGLWLGAAPSTTAAASYLVLLPLAVLGGLGLPVLIELSDRMFGGLPLSRHSRVVLALAAIVYLIGLAALVAAQTPAAAGGGWPAWHDTLASCSVAAINSRTAGMPFESPAAFTAAGQWVLMALMLIGAAPAGTAGGLKVTTFWHLAAGVRDALAGRAVHRAAGIAAVWVCIYLLVLFAGFLLLLVAVPQVPADRLLFLTTSAIGNVGLSHDPVSITGSGLLVLSGLMLFGRLAPLAVLWWMAETTTDAQVAVG